MKRMKHMFSVALVYAMISCLSIQVLAAGEGQIEAVVEIPEQTEVEFKEMNAIDENCEKFSIDDQIPGDMVPFTKEEEEAYQSKLLEENIATVPTEAQAYQSMIALQTDYPEGMSWTNDDYYAWNGGIYRGGYGCAGFAFLLSDAAFGELPARIVENITIDDVHVGDILRVNNDGHSVVVMEKYSDYVVLAEGNYNYSIHWGRTYSAAAIAQADYMMTRYPVGTFGEVNIINYDNNGGAYGPEQQIFNPGKSVIIPNQFPNNGVKTFMGWGTSADATQPSYQPGDMYSGGSITLYAIWGAPSGTSISNDFPQTYPVDIAWGGQTKVFQFKPSVSGTYHFESEGSLDTWADLYDSSETRITYNDDGGENRNFLITQDLTAGQTYYFRVKLYGGSATGQFSVNVYKDSKEVGSGFTYEPLSATTAKITGCTLTGDIVIPETIDGYTITNLEPGLFNTNSYVTTVSIPKTIRAFDYFDYVFSYCYNMTAITVASDNPYLCSVDGVLYSKDKTVLYHYPCSKTGSTFSTLSETTYLCCTSFARAWNLTRLNLTNMNTDWAGYTFSGDPNLSVYYKTGGESEKRAQAHISQGKSHETDPNFPTFVVASESKPVITIQPTAQSVKEGSNATFKVVATGSGLTYQWQYSQDNGTTWKNSGAASAVTNTYVLGAKMSRNGYLIRCIVTDAAGKTATSNAVKLTVTAVGPVITTQPKAVTAVEGTNATFKIVATGSGLTYQWQYSQDNGSTWKNSGAASGLTATYVLGATTSRNGYLIRCKVKDSSGTTKTSSAVKLTVTPAGPVITTQPKAVTAVEGTNATFKIVATGSGLTYQWQYSQDNGSTWKNSGAASGVTANYVLGATTSRNGYMIRCKVTAANGKTVTSSAVKLTVTPAGLVITTQPKAVTATEGTNATFKIVATGSGLTYQWQYSQDNGSTWKNSGAASGLTANYVLGATASRNGYLIRCKVKDSSGTTKTSSAVKLTVTPAGPVITTQPKAVTATEGTNANFKIVATGSGLTYQWQYSQDNGSTWKNSGAASGLTANYVLGATASRNGYLIRCKVKDSSGTTKTSSAVKLTVNPRVKLAITTQPTAQNVAVGGKVSFKIVAVGNGLTYQWKYSKDGGKTWDNSGATGATTANCSFTAKAAHDGFLYKCVVKDDGGNSLSSYVAQLIIE